MHVFPYITHIEDVLPSLEGRDEFIVADRDTHKIINYVVDFSDTFVDDNGFGTPTHWMRRECRGLIFDAGGNIIRRPFHKFANIGQWKENQIGNLDLSLIRRFMCKEDGSFISPFFIDGALHWGTKMGVTDIGLKAAEFVNKSYKFVEFAHWCHANGITPIFEYVAPDNRIVIAYEEENMILLGMRNMFTGAYFDIYTESIIKELGITVVSTLELEKTSSFIDVVRAFKDSEGVVIEFENGERHKCKADKYVELHRIFDALSKEHHIITSLLAGTLDDILPSLDVPKRKYVDEIVDKFKASFDDVETRMKKHKEQLYEKFYVDGKFDKKRVALEYVKLHPKDSVVIFRIVDGKDITETLLDIAASAANKETKWKEFKEWML